VYVYKYKYAILFGIKRFLVATKGVSRERENVLEIVASVLFLLLLPLLDAHNKRKKVRKKKSRDQLSNETRFELVNEKSNQMSSGKLVPTTSD